MNAQELLMENKRVNLTLAIEDVEKLMALLPVGTPITTGVTDIVCDFIEERTENYQAKSRVKRGRNQEGKFTPRKV